MIQDPNWTPERMVELDDAWRTPRVRREFELDTGTPPLLSGQRQEMEQIESGTFDAYRDDFVRWLDQRSPKREQSRLGLS